MLTFIQSDTTYIYHYCFLVPSNLIEDVLAWAQARMTVLEVADEQFIEDYADWGKSKLFYFYDASGNVAEIIARGDLDNPSNEPFSVESIMNINEIGLVSDDLVKTNAQLESDMQSTFFQGDLKRIGTNGNWQGLFILVNHTRKKNWYPTNTQLRPEPLHAVIEVDSSKYDLNVNNAIMTINRQAELS